MMGLFQEDLLFTNHGFKNHQKYPETRGPDQRGRHSDMPHSRSWRGHGAGMLHAKCVRDRETAGRFVAAWMEPARTAADLCGRDVSCRLAFHEWLICGCDSALRRANAY